MPNIGRINAVREILKGTPQRISRLLVLEERAGRSLQELRELAASRDVPVQEASRKRLDNLFPRHQGVVAVVSPRGYAPLSSLLNKDGQAFLVLLDGVQDPQNLGAILRAAEGAGVDGVILPEKRSAGLTPAVTTASAGAAEHVPVVQVTNLVRTMEFLKKSGLWLVGADSEGERSWDQFDYRGPLGLVFGSEGRGLRPLVRRHCDVILSLPLAGRVTSLNVAAAAAVFMYEVVRQRRGPEVPVHPNPK